MYEDGSLARPPIAIAEVQGYLYEAWLATANLARELKAKKYITENQAAESWIADLEKRAKALKAVFNEKFYWPEEN